MADLLCPKCRAAMESLERGGVALERCPNAAGSSSTEANPSRRRPQGASGWRPLSGWAADAHGSFTARSRRVLFGATGAVVTRSAANASSSNAARTRAHSSTASLASTRPGASK